ncbi:FKBP-type peptidyl-prolyl cis-trans isomerase [Candidatus Dependentiae bacterium]|nr:FKBP-type peptidyl-prolyl cis-trans isomerase [Candidatus Dependentiae bacterium]
MKKTILIICGSIVYISAFSGCVEKTKEIKETEKIITKKEVKMITNDSGLKYEILKEGTSEKTPQKGQKVVVHYTGWLEENGEKGKKFDSSVDRGAPFTFTIGVGQVIKGWDQGVASMKVGEKRKLIIPSELGYGSRGAGHVIPPNATLIFEVALLDIK